MNIIIIGNGVAGQTCAEKLLSLQKEQNTSHEITIITEEKYSYYSRINLPKYLTDEITKEKLILRKPEWFTERGINLRWLPGWRGRWLHWRPGTS